MSKEARRATLVGIAANTFLFVIKAFVGLFTGSLAILSDAANSFSDMVYSTAVFLAVRLSYKKADANHPFGHHRAEPMAGLLIAILMGILGFEIVKTGVFGFLGGVEAKTFSVFGVIVLLVCMTIKAGMWRYFRAVAKRINSPTIHASSIDARNDVLISFSALLGISGSLVGLNTLDYYAATVIGAFIIWSGYKIGVENIDYLMGKAPSKEIMEKICERAGSIEGIKGIHDVRAHYVGNYIHVQVHLEIDKNIDMNKAHAIGKKVQKLIEDMPTVDNAFIHLDPR